MSEKILPKPSNEYLARRTGPMVIKSEESGALSLYIPYALVGLQDMEFSDVHKVTLVKIDGTVLTNSQNNILKIWPEASEDYPFSLEDLPMPEDTSKPEFKLSDCYHDDSWTPEGADAPVIQFKARWLNPLEGGGKVPERMSEDERRKILAKFGSRFNALKPATTSKPTPKSAEKEPERETEKEPQKTAEKKGGMPTRKSMPARAGSSSVGGVARTANQDEVYDALVNSKPDENPDKLAEVVFKVADEVCPDYKKTGDISKVTPAQWGKIADKLGV